MTRSYTIFTAEGISFETKGTNLKNALSRGETLGNTPVAIVETDSLVQPVPGRLTALIVRPAQRGTAT